MRETNAICTKCREVISVDANEEATICPKCKKAIIVEKAVSEYEKCLKSCNAICPKCNACISVDVSDDASICSMCGKPIVTSKAAEAFKAKFLSTDRSAGSVKESPKEDFNYCGDGAIDDYYGEGGVVVIPSDVTFITEFAFSSHDEITDIIIPQSVRWIGTNAFMECEGLTRIVIPASVEEIGEEAFIECPNLKEVVFERTDGWYADGKPIVVSYPKAMAYELVNGRYSGKTLTRK